MNVAILGGFVFTTIAWMRVPLTWERGTIKGDMQTCAVMALGLALFMFGTL